MSTFWQFFDVLEYHHPCAKQTHSTAEDTGLIFIPKPLRG